MLINGVTGDLISIRDRGLLYGDGVFRTLRSADARALHWPLHYQKLQHDCSALGITCPDFGRLSSELASLLVDHPDAVLKIIVTRGQGMRGYAPIPLSPSSLPQTGERDVVSQRESLVYAVPTHIWDVSPLPVYPASNATEGVTLCLCTLRLSHQPRLAGIKHLNRLENVLAAAECTEVNEGLLLDVDGLVIEGVRSNVFLIKQGCLITPELSRCGVAGVQRDRVMDCARQIGMQVEVRDVGLDELHMADEVFLTNSVFGLWPVARLADKVWTNFAGAASLCAALENGEIDG
ncbi:MAG: aminotransferase class IV [Gallionella sp.]|jgi:4-amino-4-deoxychorismate lyase